MATVPRSDAPPLGRWAEAQRARTLRHRAAAWWAGVRRRAVPAYVGWTWRSGRLLGFAVFWAAMAVMGAYEPYLNSLALDFRHLPGALPPAPTAAVVVRFVLGALALGAASTVLLDVVLGVGPWTGTAREPAAGSAGDV